MTGEVGSLWVRLLGDTSKFEGAMAGVGQTMQGIGQKTSALGADLTRSLTLPILGIGAGLVALGSTTESAMATIRAGTGATGEELGALGEDFRAVFAGVPEGAADVSTAIADLNRRLGLTGEPLQELTFTMLDLAGLTKTQVGPLIAQTTRVFGDWGVATEDAEDTLDLLYRTTQTTGIGIDQLSAALVQFGAPLRAMDFSIEESAALLGKWEAEGVNTELVLGSLRIAMGQFAKDGIPMREGLDATIAKIQKLGPSAEATALAMETFGARAGPDMAAAILEGRFEIDELLATIRDGPDTIERAGAETETFTEKLARLRNQVVLAVEPLAIRLMGALEGLLPQVVAVVGVIAGAVEAFAALPEGAQVAGLGLAGFGVAIGPVLFVVGKLTSAVGALTVGLAALPLKIAAVKAKIALLLGPIALIGAAIALVAVAWTQNWGGIQEKTAAAIESVKGLIGQAVAFVEGIWAAHGEQIMATVGALWEGLQSAVAAGVEIIRGLVEGALAIVAGLWEAHGERIMAIISVAWGLVRGIFETALGVIRGIVAAISAAISGDWRGFGRILRETIEAAWEAIKGVFGRAWEAIKRIVSDLVADVVRFFRETDWGAVGRGIIDGIVAGIKAAVQFLIDAAVAAARAAIEAVKGFLGITSPSELAAQAIGRPFVEGIKAGIDDEMSRLAPFTVDVRGVGLAAPAVAGPAGGITVGDVHFHVQHLAASEAEARSFARQLWTHLEDEAFRRGRALAPTRGGS